MRYFDVQGMCSTIQNRNVELLWESISNQPTDELVTIYKSLEGIVSYCLSLPNVPEVAEILSELSHAYGIEIANRHVNLNVEHENV